MELEVGLQLLLQGLPAIAKIDYRTILYASAKSRALKRLSDKTWAKQQVDYSLNAWLKQRQVPAETETNGLEAMLSALTIDDENYLVKLKDCWTALVHEGAIARIDTLLSAIEQLKGV